MKILFVTLSNIGDCILTLPALDILKANFAQAFIDVIVSPRAQDIFNDTGVINQCIIYDKHSSLKEKIALMIKLRKQEYDMVIDLRNSMFQLLMNVPYKTTPFMRISKDILHMKDRHIERLLRVIAAKVNKENIPRQLFPVSLKDASYIDNIIGEKPFMVIAAGARSHTKRWPEEKFSELCQNLIERYQTNPVRKLFSNGAKIILAGDEADKEISSRIVNAVGNELVNLCGKTTLRQLAELLRKASLVISNDSAVMHLASYLDIPIVAIFGITDPQKYGPWSSKSILVRKMLDCSPCQKAQCPFDTLQCIRDISVEDVLKAISQLLNDADERI